MSVIRSGWAVFDEDERAFRSAQVRPPAPTVLQVYRSGTVSAPSISIEIYDGGWEFALVQIPLEAGPSGTTEIDVAGEIGYAQQYRDSGTVRWPAADGSWFYLRFQGVDIEGATEMAQTAVRDESGWSFTPEPGFSLAFIGDLRTDDRLNYHRYAAVYDIDGTTGYLEIYSADRSDYEFLLTERVTAGFVATDATITGRPAVILSGDRSVGISGGTVVWFDESGAIGELRVLGDLETLTTISQSVVYLSETTWEQLASSFPEARIKQ